MKAARSLLLSLLLQCKNSYREHVSKWALCVPTKLFIKPHAHAHTHARTEDCICPVGSSLPILHPYRFTPLWVLICENSLICTLVIYIASLTRWLVNYILKSNKQGINTENKTHENRSEGEKNRSEQSGSSRPLAPLSVPILYCRGSAVTWSAPNARHGNAVFQALNTPALWFIFSFMG